MRHTKLMYNQCLIEVHYSHMQPGVGAMVEAGVGAGVGAGAGASI